MNGCKLEGGYASWQSYKFHIYTPTLWPVNDVTGKDPYSFSGGISPRKTPTGVNWNFSGLSGWNAPTEAVKTPRGRSKGFFSVTSLTVHSVPTIYIHPSIEKLTLGFSLLIFLSVILASFFCIEVLIVVESYPKTAASGVWCTMFFIYMTYTLLALHLQGISYWSGHYKLALTDTNVQVKSCLKLVWTLRFGIFW